MPDDFERLRAIVTADEALEADLARETEVSTFIARLMRLAVEHDLVIAEGTVWSAIERGRQFWLRTCAP